MSEHAQAIPQPKLSAEFRRLKAMSQADRVPLVIIFRELRSRGHALITLLFALPFLLPIPVPGLSIIFGLVIALAGVQIALHQKPWLPRRWLKTRISGGTLRTLFVAGEKVVTKLEKFTKPRGAWVVRSPQIYSTVGLLIAVCGLLLALPLPPGTNFPPASAIIFLSLGVLELDGLWIILGLLAAAINMIFFTLLFTLGYEAVIQVVPYLLRQM